MKWIDNKLLMPSWSLMSKFDTMGKVKKYELTLDDEQPFENVAGVIMDRIEDISPNKPKRTIGDQ